MIPDRDIITIRDNETHIRDFLNDLIIKPRNDILKWSRITKQTPTLKIGYVGQHLTSLILGMEGGRTGARGHDIIDGTEVKSCTKVDQADKCKDCDGRVMRTEEVCPHCDSENIDRKDDSKWLFSIRTEEELNQLTNSINRVFLLISDYPNFRFNDFTSIRFEGFEIYPNNIRMSVFKELLTDYYYNNYLPKATANRKTAPMNLHPYKFQFYMCNPIKVFSCLISSINTTTPLITINKYIQPELDRSDFNSEDMPIDILTKNELLDFCNTAPYETVIRPLLLDQSLPQPNLISILKRSKKEQWKNYIPNINEEGRNYIQLRNIVVAPQTAIYRRS